MTGSTGVKLISLKVLLATLVAILGTATVPLVAPSASHLAIPVSAATVTPSFRSTLPVVATNGHAGLYGWGAATMPDGSVIVGDIWNHRVVHYDVNGNFLGVLFTQSGGFAPYGLAVDPRNSTIYVGFSQCCEVQRFGLQNGVYVQLPSIMNSSFHYPSRLAITDDGWVYIADMLQNTIFVYDSNLTFQFQIGTRGTKGGQLIQPRGLAFDGSNPQRLFVMDSYNYRVSVFTRTGTFLYTFGSKGSNPGQFPDNNTRGLAIDRVNGWVYTVDDGNNLVDKFDLAGNFLLALGGVGGHNTTVCCVTPLGKFSDGGREDTVDGNGNLWVGDMPNFRVQVFAPDGTPLFAEPNPPQLPAPGAFAYPEGVAIDSQGNIIVDDTRNFRIQKFSPTGQFLWQMGQRGRFNGYALNYANLIATDPNDDSIVLADDYNNTIKKYDQNGVFQWQVGQAACGTVINTFCHPVGVTVGPDSRIYVTDTHNNRVVVLGSDGTWLSSFTYSLFKSPRGIDIDPATGNLFVGDFVRATVTEFTNTGTFIRTFGGHGTTSSSLSNPWGVAVDASYLYVADNSLNVIKVYNQNDGTFVTSFGGRGSGPGQFSGPEAVALGANGILYVTDTFDDRIELWCVECAGPSAPTYVRTIGQTGAAQLYPSGIDVDSSGNVAVADTGNDVVNYYAAGSSTPAWSQGTRSLTVGGGTDTFEDPRDVAMDSSRVFVADTGNQIVQVLNKSTGSFVQSLNYKFSAPWGVSVGSDGLGNERIFVADGGNGNVEIFDGSLNHLSTIPAISSNEGTRDAMSDSLGNIYVADYRNDRIDKYSSAGTLLLQWGGSSAPSCQQIPKPFGVAVDGSDHVYVASSSQQVIKEFNTDGSCVGTFGSKGSGPNQFVQLRRVAVGGPSNLVFGADLWGYKVLVFNPDGTIASTQPELGDGNTPAAGGLNEVHGVAVTSSYVFAPDTVNQRIERFNPDGTGPIAWTFGTPESASGLNWAQGIGVNPSDGNVWVADTKNNRIDEFSTGGSGPLRSLVNGTGGVALNGPTSVSFDGNGNMYIADSGGNDIQSYAVPLSGTPTLRWSIGTSGKGTGQFKMPGDVIYDGTQSSPRLLVADTGNSRVVTLDPNTGAWIAVMGMVKGSGVGQISSPGGLAVTSTGTIWVADTANDRIEAFNPDGTFANEMIGSFGTSNSQFNAPQAIEVGPDGLLYVADTQNNRIQVFQP